MFIWPTGRCDPLGRLSWSEAGPRSSPTPDWVAFTTTSLRARRNDHPDRPRPDMATHHCTQLGDHDFARMTDAASQVISQSLRSLAIVEVVHRDVDTRAPARGPGHCRQPHFLQAGDRLRRSAPVAA